MSDDAAAATAADWRRAVDLGRLAAWMDGQGLAGGPIVDAAPIAGGTQNLLLRLRRGGREFVLRRPPLHARAGADATIAREARLLRALEPSRVPHPRLVAACADAGVLGAAFYLMEPVRGFNPSGRPLPAPHAADAAWRRRMGFAMVDALLRLGEVDADAAGLADFGRPQGFLERQVPRWQAQLAGYAQEAGWPGADGLPGVRRVGDWLQAHCPARFVPGVMHGDFHLSNVMFCFDVPEIAAVVDWELATVGDPLLDLGWLVATWPDDDGQGAGTIRVAPWSGFPSADELVQRYRDGSARDLAAIDWYVALASYKLAILLEGSHARACAGKAPRAVGERHHASARRLVERALECLERAH